MIPTPWNPVKGNREESQREQPCWDEGEDSWPGCCRTVTECLWHGGGNTCDICCVRDCLYVCLLVCMYACLSIYVFMIVYMCVCLSIHAVPLEAGSGCWIPQYCSISDCALMWVLETELSSSARAARVQLLRCLSSPALFLRQVLQGNTGWIYVIALAPRLLGCLAYCPIPRPPAMSLINTK